MQRRIIGQNKSALPSTAGVAPVTLGLQIHRTSHRTIFVIVQQRAILAVKINTIAALREIVPTVFSDLPLLNLLIVYYLKRI